MNFVCYKVSFPLSTNYSYIHYRLHYQISPPITLPIFTDSLLTNLQISPQVRSLVAALAEKLDSSTISLDSQAVANALYGAFNVYEIM